MLATHLGWYNTATSRTHVRFQFSTHNAAGANVAPSSAIDAADIRIYKATDGAAFSATQRSSANGITCTSPFDSLTGFHDLDIDLTDNTDAGFYVAGSFYSVVLAPSDETIDSQVITGVVLAYFEIGVAPANVTQFGGTAGTFASGRPEANVNAIAANAITAAATAADFGTEIGTAVWATTTRELTALDEDNTTIDLNGTTIGTVTNLTNKGDGSGFTAIPWNAAWDAEVQSEVADALAVYDPPTRTEAASDKDEILTAVADLPTNAELATALGTADDAVLAAIAALNNLSAAQVATEIADALGTDTYAEPGQGNPAATATLATKIGFLYKAWRNRSTQTASEYALYADDATTKDQEAAVSDNGTTLDRGEVATGA